MTRTASSVAHLLVAAPLLLVSLTTRATALTGTVASVADGDTITILDAHHQQHKIRVAGIDAPAKAQPFGRRSKESLAAMVFWKAVDVHWHKQDRYQCIVGKVMVADPGCRASQCPKTLDAGLAQLTLGLAWWYEKYAWEQSPDDAGRYEFAEHEARAKRVGLWADGHPVPPWEWRRGDR
ncbi:MAG: thermonuclease family protein [Candidatus Accumulibacter necessarius]|jgi:endonuclease YncB( thermonuclease family)